MINARERAELRKASAKLSADQVPLAGYRRELRYLGLVPGWGTQALRMHFGEAMDKLGEIEPVAELFIQDQLRGSPLLFYSQTLDGLSRDANQLAGVQHKLLGQRHRHRIQCAEPRAGTRSPARIARHEACRRLPT